MKKLIFSVAFVLAFFVQLSNSTVKAQNVFSIEPSTTYVLPSNFNPLPVGGDTIKIQSGRTETLKFKGFEGDENNPIVFINDGGQVHINTTAWGALTFENCKYIKISGAGDPNIHYGFKLQGGTSGLSFLEYSSDCEVEFVEIEGIGTTFFGIYAKKDFSGNPPTPYPIFKNLSIHDTYIHDLAEGMYIGETISPGMEFHHLRVYNNVVVNTQRESVQIANCVDDIEIYNNFFLNAGLDDMVTQNNGLQIGTNTIANVYNNVIINSLGFGTIVLGNGDINLNNNYISDSKGIFIDDRFAPLDYSPIQIDNNFIANVNNNPIIENLNEINDIYIRNNIYNTDSLFFKNAVEPLGLIELSNNLLNPIVGFDYNLDQGIFQNSPSNPASYQTMGPINGLTHNYNASPVLNPIEDIILEYDSSANIQLTANASDGDIVHFESRNLPAFADLIETASGAAELSINPTQENIGVYEIGIRVYDESHHAYDRQMIQLSVMNPQNTAPVLNFDTQLTLESASHFEFDITAFDAESDSLYYAINPLPSFAKLIKKGEQVILDLQPKISDKGDYTIEISANDGYGVSTTRTLNLTIIDPNLYEGRTIYRVNFGGPELEDSLLNWQADILSSAVYSTSYFLRTGSWSWNGVNTTSAPNNLFGPFRYDVSGGTEMQYEFPLSENGRYEVKLFFAERSTEVNANTTGTFNVYLENEKVLNAFNIYQNSTYEANEQSFEILVEDQLLNLELEQIENNSKINGIEINYLGEPAENVAPEIQSLTPISLSENDSIEIPLQITDDNFEGCNSLSITATNAPGFFSIAPNENEFSILLQPTYEDAAFYDSIELIISDGCLESRINLSIEVLNTNRIPQIETINPIEIQAANSIAVDVSASDADSDALNFQLKDAPAFITLNTINNGSAELLINPLLSDVGEFSFQVEVSDQHGGFASTPVLIHSIAPPESIRIPLNTSMITDLVDRGSRFSPLYLVNEQNRDPYLDQHPRSKSWLPSKYPIGSPFSTLIDLGAEYYIDYAMLHDMRQTGELYFSIGSPDNWTEVTSYTTSSFKQWREVDLKRTSRYLLLTMYNTVNAKINEIALYGYLTNAVEKSNIIHSSFGKIEYQIYPNPCQNFLHIKNKTENQTMEIIDSDGRILLRTNDKIAEIGNLPSGIYLLRLYDHEQIIFQDRFIKQ